MALWFFKKEANFIKSLITHPCARPWFVYAETFLPAFLKLLITVVLFDVEDALRAHGESIVRDRHAKKGKRHTKKMKVQNKGINVARYAQKGLKVLLIVTEPLEKIGFAWLVFSAVDQFFYDWQMLLQKSDYCVDRGQSGPLTLARGPGFISIVIGFVPVILNITEQNRPGFTHTAIGADIPHGAWHCLFALTVKGPIGGVSNVIIRVRTPGALGADTTESEPLALAHDEEGSMVVKHDFFLPLVGGGSLTWEIGGETIPAGIEAVKGHMIVFVNLPGGIF